MTPDEAVSQLANFIASRSDFTEDDVYAAMRRAGVPDAQADRAYKFTLFAWGRVFLDGLGVRFSPDYLCFNREGEVVEAGRLDEEPYYAAAMRLAPEYETEQGFAAFALLSADVQAVNSALNNGSRPEDLEAAPAATFLEAPTAAGMENARRVLDRHLGVESSSAARPAPPKKPWWKVW